MTTINSLSVIDNFIKDSKEIVSSLVKNFDKKKKALTLTKTKQYQTGTLNMNRISYYKTSDDIFLSKENLPEGKNHSYFVLVDFSGSMKDIISEVLKTSFILCQFFTKVGIDFNFVTFTSDYRHDNIKLIDNSNNLFNLQLNKLFSSDYSYQVNLMRFKEAWSYFNRAGGSLSFIKRHDLYLGGTPLTEALLFSFNAMLKRKIEKNITFMNFITITDGGGMCHFSENTFVSPFNKKRYKIKHSHDNKIVRYSINYTIIDMIKDHGIGTYGFYISEDYQSVNYCINEFYQNYEYSPKYQANNICGIDDFYAYDTMFFMPKNSLRLDNKTFKQKKEIGSIISKSILKNI